MSFVINPLFKTDAYKLSHKGFMVPNTQMIYSNMTARSDRYLPVPHHMKDGKTVWFGGAAAFRRMRDMWNEHFFRRNWDDLSAELERMFDAFLGKGKVDLKHFQELHKLGYLPLIIKMLPEGSRVNIKVPYFTIRNTHQKFAWLTNYLETWLSATLWKPTTVATIIYHYRKLSNKWALLTTGSTAGTEFQNHDFSYRGLSDGDYDPAATGAGFLLSSCGTDNIPALPFIEQYYKTDVTKTFVGTSVPASEHSLACAGIAFEGEEETFRRWITKDYPTGIVSIIADTEDFFKVITETATNLKQDILNRQPDSLGLAKVVFRPDSGDPVKIITGYNTDGINYASEQDVYDQYDYESSLPEAVQINGKYFELDGGSLDGRANIGKELSEAEVKGAVQCMWNIFGGTATTQGYRLLHERVGLIYGDSITLERAEQIYTRLAAKQFASTNVVLGVGSFTCQYLTRDSMGIAIKATASVMSGALYALSKNPKTDDGTKKSARGLLQVEHVNGEFVLHDEQTWEQEEQGALVTVFQDGKLIEENLDDFTTIRERLWKD